jgi:hypothetical protein
MPEMSVAEIKRTLLNDYLRAEPGLQGVQIAYGYPARDIERELLYGGAARFTRAIDSMGGGMGGVSYTRTVTVDLHLQVRIPGGSVEESETRVIELGTVVEEFFNRNPRLADLPGLLHSGVVAGELGYAIDDDAVTSALQLSVELTTYP